MVDNKAFLSRVYELSGAETPTELSRWVELSLTAVLNWESGWSSPGLKTLWRIREKTGEDLSPLVHVTSPKLSESVEQIPTTSYETPVYETDETTIALSPHFQMLTDIYRARDDPNHRHRWSALSEHIADVYERVTGKDSRKILHGKRDRKFSGRG